MTDTTSSAAPASGPVPAAPAPHPATVTPPAAASTEPSATDNTAPPVADTSAPQSDATSNATPGSTSDATGTVAAVGNETSTTAPVGDVPATDTASTAAPAAPVAPVSLVGALDDAARAVREETLGITGMAKELKDYILHVLDNGTQISRDLISHVLDYLKKMSPTAPTSPTTGATHQESLYREIMNAIDNHVGPDFHEMMNCLLAIIHHSKTTGGAFAFHLWARFLPEWKLGEAEARKFLNLGQLFRSTSDGATRKLALKQIDLDKAMENLLPATRERLESFFRT